MTSPRSTPGLGHRVSTVHSGFGEDFDAGGLSTTDTYQKFLDAIDDAELDFYIGPWIARAATHGAVIDGRAFSPGR